MKISSRFFIILLIFLGCTSEKEDSFYQGFIDPPVEAKPFLRWYWSGNHIEADEIKRELDSIAQKGIGGVEIFPVGMPENAKDIGTEPVEWLSEEWNELLALTSNEVESKNMIIDLMVGGGWPFGGEYLEEDETVHRVIINEITINGPTEINENFKSLFNRMLKKNRNKSPYVYRDMQNAESNEMFFISLIPENATSEKDVIDLMKHYNDNNKEIKYNIGDGTYDLKYGVLQKGHKEAKKSIPQFAFEYLDGGCNEELNIKKNTEEIREIEFEPKYIGDFNQVDLSTKLFGFNYDAPFGIAPIGLQGLIWPNSPEILAKAAKKNNIPFILSTVSTSNIEKIAQITEGKAWFQLYHPAKQELTDDLLQRAEQSGYQVLVILADVPSFGYRAKDIKNGLSMPPKMTLRNILQILSKPGWSMNTLKYGVPSFKSLEPYMDKSMNLSQLGKFMDDTFSGRLNDEKIARLRDQWKGKLVLKGIGSTVDVGKAIQLGIDGVIVSNHGGRQLDAGPSSIKVLKEVVKKYHNQITIMMDSGIRSGPDMARVMASGAEFTFLGRTFMYGVAALGNKGGEHVITMLRKQLIQVMEQVGCDSIGNFKKYLLQNEKLH